MKYEQEQRRVEMDESFVVALAFEFENNVKMFNFLKLTNLYNTIKKNIQLAPKYLK